MTTKQQAELIASVLIERLPANLYDDVRDDFEDLRRGGGDEQFAFARAMVDAMEKEATRT